MLHNGAVDASGDSAAFTGTGSLQATASAPPAPDTSAPAATSDTASNPSADPTDAQAPAPTLIDIRYPHRVRLRRGKPTLINFRIVSSGAGSLEISAGAHSYDDPADQVSVDPALKAGVNNLTLRLPKGYHHRRDLIFFTQFSLAFSDPSSTPDNYGIAESATGR